MAASRDTRYHEAAHAVTAHILGIDIRDEGMVLKSDQEAWVAISEVVPGGADEDWFVRRVAVKLAGPLAMCRLRHEALEWDTLRYSAEYHSDFEDALNIFLDYWRNIRCPGDSCIDEQMNRSACLAMECVSKNQPAILAIVEASDGKDRFCRDEIINIIRQVRD